MANYGGLPYELWNMMADQRPIGMDVGAIKIEACEIVFDWLEIEQDERPTLWLKIRSIDHVYLKARETLKKTQEKGKKPVRKK